MKDLTYKNLIQNNLGILVVDVTLTSQKLYPKHSDLTKTLL